MAESRMGMRIRNSTNLQTAALAGLLVLLIAIVLAWFIFPIKDWVLSFMSWINGLGILGMVVFALVYVVVVVLLAPAGVMSIAAGFVFGAWAFPIVVVAATVGAALAFLLSRYLARPRVKALMQMRPMFNAVDHAVEEEGWKIVALLRLNPVVPFNLQNYFFGVVRIPFSHYLAATFFGIMPGAAAHVYAGMLGRIAAGAEEDSSINMTLLIVGFTATIVMIVIVARKAKMKLESMGIKKSTA